MRSRFLVAAFLAALSLTAAAQAGPPRPKILGISHIAIYASDLAAEDHYYREVIGAVKQPDPENPKGMRYAVSATQFIEILPLPPDAGINRLDHTAYRTDNAEGMRKYLAAKGYKTPGKVEKGSDGSRWFEVNDPEGNKVQFVQPPRNPKAVNAPNVISSHIIHVGFLVHSRAVEDTFYRDLLGFRPYWYGGVNPGQVDWVTQQTPDSHDWLEYMIKGGTPGSYPPGMTQHQLAVLDHLSLGVVSVDACYKMLQDGNRLTGVHDAHTQMGKDGKVQVSLYDPEGFRAVLTQLRATGPICCSVPTAEDPSE
jgi:catechol 2,3-dioxygenase-like lactoylglutathione lyase family enzyme